MYFLWLSPYLTFLLKSPALLMFIYLVTSYPLHSCELEENNLPFIFNGLLLLTLLSSIYTDNFQNMFLQQYFFGCYSIVKTTIAIATAKVMWPHKFGKCWIKVK